MIHITFSIVKSSHHEYGINSYLTHRLTELRENRGFLRVIHQTSITRTQLRHPEYGVKNTLALHLEKVELVCL